MWQQTLDGTNSARIRELKRSDNAQPRPNIANRLERSPTKSRLQRSEKTHIDDYHDFDEAEEGSLNLTSNSQPNIALGPVVQISQHSSFDRGQYLRYHSSVSVYSLYSSAPPHADSGLGESSPPPEALDSSKSDLGGIVPDSQSLLGSSSYRPTASTSEDTDRLHQRGHRNSSLHCSLGSAVETLENSDLFETFSDSIRNSSGIYVAESPESRFWSQRSTSVPAQGVTATASSDSSSVGLLACLNRSTSDPSPLVYGTPEGLFDTLGGHLNPRQRVVSGNKRGSVVLDSENDQEVEGIEPSNPSESYSQVCVVMKITHSIILSLPRPRAKCQELQLETGVLPPILFFSFVFLILFPQNVVPKYFILTQSMKSHFQSQLLLLQYLSQVRQP